MELKVIVLFIALHIYTQYILLLLLLLLLLFLLVLSSHEIVLSIQLPSVHPVSVLIPYPREIPILWPQTVRQRKTKKY